MTRLLLGTLLGLSAACASHQTGASPRAWHSPRIEGVLRPGDPYGRPSDVVGDHAVALALGASAARCDTPVAQVRTDSLGRFAFAPASGRGMTGTDEVWWVCVGPGSRSAPSYPMFRGEGPRRTVVQLECEMHGDSGSPLCEERRRSPNP